MRDVQVARGDPAVTPALGVRVWMGVRDVRVLHLVVEAVLTGTRDSACLVGVGGPRAGATLPPTRACMRACHQVVL